MANRLLSLIDIIDNNIARYYIKDIRFYGLCSQESIKNERRPVYYNGNKYLQAGFDEGSALSVYHRLLSNSEVDNVSDGFGSSLLKTETFTLTSVVFGSQKKIDPETFDISYKIGDGIKGLLQSSLTRLQLENINAQSVSILITSVNYNKRDVFATELPDTNEYFIKPDNILFSINYTINAKYIEDCKTGDCDNDPIISDCIDVSGIDEGDASTVYENNFVDL